MKTAWELYDQIIKKAYFYFYKRDFPTFDKVIARKEQSSVGSAYFILAVFDKYQDYKQFTRNKNFACRFLILRANSLFQQSFSWISKNNKHLKFVYKCSECIQIAYNFDFF